MTLMMDLLGMVMAQGSMETWITWVSNRKPTVWKVMDKVLHLSNNLVRIVQFKI